MKKFERIIIIGNSGSGKTWLGSALPHLALVEIHESWTAEGDEDDPEPEDLIDDSTTLSYWLGAHDNKLSYGTYSLSKDEICWTKDLEEFEPYETEYEGYMGIMTTERDEKRSKL